MATFKINGKNFATQSGTGEPTVSSNVVFPAGHIIAHATPFYDPGVDSSIETNSNSFQETGIECSITTKESSSNSKIVCQFYTGYARMSGGNSAFAIWTVGRATATSTTYSSATDLSDDQSSVFYPGNVYDYWSQHSTWVDTGSFSADTTYFYQVYLRSYTTNTTRLVSSGGATSLIVYQVKI
tara:strand:- start:47 stop:595 length:549 start_codon:yes stop_codon:yes gene_type:complete